MNKIALSLVWWNTNLSPPIKRKSNQNATNEDRLLGCCEIIQNFMYKNYDFICLCEVSPYDIDFIVNKINITESNYTYIDGYEEVGKLIFDTCILFNKDIKFNIDGDAVRNIIYGSGGRQIKVGQRYEFYLPHIDETLVLYLSHWPSRQSADDMIYGGIAQDLRGTLDGDLKKGHHVILAGDYNVEPHHNGMVFNLQASREKDLVTYRQHLLYNPCWKFLTISQHGNLKDVGTGTFYLRASGLFNSWHVIDQILLSRNFLKQDWIFLDEMVEIIDTSLMLGNSISDHMAISIFIERA